MLFQAGSNGNVCGYNYSFNPYWSQFPFPTNSAGDIVFHGNYPFSNLCEGNINQNTVIDNSHANNGPYNTIFRNRSETYGIVMNNNPATDTVQFLGNEVTNSSLGQYLLYGNGHLQYGNKINGVLTPAGTNNLTESSLYLPNPQKPLCFNPGNNNWPVIGIPNGFNTGSNVAKDRVMHGVYAACVCTPSFVTTIAENKVSTCKVFPNPAGNFLNILTDEAVNEVSVYSLDGRLQLNHRGKNIKYVDISGLTAGIYLIGIKCKKEVKTYKLIKE
jgi:hypothetical protein